MSHSQELFDQAVQAARSGARQRALALFLKYVEQEENNIQAWLWLSRLVEDHADRIIALENALDLCQPGSDLERSIRSRLAVLREEQSAAPAADKPVKGQKPFEQMLQQAIYLRDAGRNLEAVQLLEEVVAEQPEDEYAWLLLSETSADPSQKVRALERVLTINPENREAALRYESLRQVEQDPLKRGSYLEAQGELELATMIYISVLTHSRLPAERVEAQRRIDAIKMRQEVDSIHKVDPTLNLVRLTLGPVALFAIMVFMQSGLNPLHTPFVAILGLLSVLAGSLLVSVTDLRPAHPRWVQIFGPPGMGDEPEMRRALRLLGWALLFAPFTIFLLEAGHRLGVMQASLLAH